MSRRNRALATVAVVAGLLAAGAGAYRWRAEQRARVIAPQLGQAPDLGALPEDARRVHGDFVRRARAGDREALGALSRFYHANGFLAEAMRCYDVLEKLQPEEPRWPHRHATIAAGFGDTEPALMRWQRVGALAPDYLPAKLRLGELLLKSNRHDEASAIFREVLQRRPDDPHAAWGLARIDVEARRWPEARERLEKLVAQTDYALGYDLIVTVYEQLGLHAQASAVRARAKASGAYRDLADPWMSELLEVCFDPYQLALAAGAAERGGDAATALRLLERAVSIAPDNVAARFQLAGLHGRARDVKRAREQLEQCTTIAPDFADGWAHLSALLEENGDRAGAERTLAAGLRQCPESPGLHLMRARQLRRTGNVASAIGAYQRSIQLRANEADPYVELATLLLQGERAREAREHLLRALAAEPDHPTALTLLALSAISLGDEPEARRWLERVRAQPRIPPAQAQQAFAAYREQFRREFP